MTFSFQTLPELQASLRDQFENSVEGALANAPRGLAGEEGNARNCLMSVASAIDKVRFLRLLSHGLPDEFSQLARMLEELGGAVKARDQVNGAGLIKAIADYRHKCLGLFPETLLTAPKSEGYGAAYVEFGRKVYEATELQKRCREFAELLGRAVDGPLEDKLTVRDANRMRMLASEIATISKSHGQLPPIAILNCIARLPAAAVEDEEIGTQAIGVAVRVGVVSHVLAQGTIAYTESVAANEPTAALTQKLDQIHGSINEMKGFIEGVSANTVAQVRRIVVEQAEERPEAAGAIVGTLLRAGGNLAEIGLASAEVATVATKDMPEANKAWWIAAAGAVIIACGGAFLRRLIGGQRSLGEG